MKLSPKGVAKPIISYQADLIYVALSGILGVGDQYALVDFPSYSNVGDSAIWLGAVAVLEKITGNKPRFVCDCHNFDVDEMRACHPDGPIFINGGGNFGDIWPTHQLFRESIMREFPDRRIVQLPQSLSFKVAGAVDDCAKAIGGHGNFTLFVRDKNSEAFAVNNFPCEVKLLPDMAFGIGVLQERVKPTSEVFMLLRSDVERGDYDGSVLQRIPNARAADWLDEPADFEKVCRLKTRMKSWGRGGANMRKGRFAHFMHLAEGRLERGLRLLCSGSIVVTDRLHAHILSTLLDKPHVVLDNNNGKIFSYIDAWTHAYPHLRKVSTPEEAVEWCAGYQGRKGVA